MPVYVGFMRGGETHAISDLNELMASRDGGYTWRGLAAP